MLSAYGWALQRGYRYPENYRGEFLVRGGYAGDSYGLLTVVELDTFVRTRLPGERELADDIYRYGGRYDNDRLRKLMGTIAGV